MTEKPKCKRCGKCCEWKLPGMTEPQKCKFLIKVSESKYLCRIYKNESRKGMKIGEYFGISIYCGDRAEHQSMIEQKEFENIDGCPYNR